MQSFLNNFSTTNSSNDVEALRVTRLSQAWLLIVITLLITTVSRFIFAKYDFVIYLLGFTATVLCIYPFIRQGRIGLAANLLCTTAIVICLFFSWVGDGIVDEANLAIPAVLMFSVVLNGVKLCVFLSVLTAINALAIGYANSTGIYVHVIQPNSMEVAITVALIIILLSLSAWILARDLKIITRKLYDEHVSLLESQQEIEDIVYNDQLTGLFNRSAAERKIDLTLAKTLENQSRYLLYFDLDKFKNINNSFGHTFGDKYLQEIAQRLSNIDSLSSKAYRIGGDEFVILTKALESDNEIDLIATEVQEAIKSPFYHQGNIASSTASIGIAHYPNDGKNFSTLFRKADIAMFYVKKRGRDDIYIYDDKLNDDIFDSLEITSDIREAIDQEQFHLNFQPKTQLDNNQVIGCEALIRWIHPKYGFISPDIFIPIAERSGLILELGNWIIKSSCEAYLQWQELGFGEVTIAINMSTLQFSDESTVDEIYRIIKTSGVPPQKIELEVTESLFVDDSELVQENLKKLRSLGLQVSIDDFGTGYSNLGYLRKLDIDTLKIDRSFIQNMNEEKHNKNIVNAIIKISQSLDIKVIAEGVEDADVAATLLAMHCEIGQGYFWSKPLALNEFKNYLLSQKNLSAEESC